MFGIFRENVKKILCDKKLTYSQLSNMSGLAESTIKCFMCGANDSRRTAERIADTLNCKIIYSNGIYELAKELDTTCEDLLSDRKQEVNN